MPDVRAHSCRLLPATSMCRVHNSPASHSARQQHEQGFGISRVRHGDCLDCQIHFLTLGQRGLIHVGSFGWYFRYISQYPYFMICCAIYHSSLVFFFYHRFRSSIFSSRNPSVFTGFAQGASVMFGVSPLVTFSSFFFNDQK